MWGCYEEVAIRMQLLSVENVEHTVIDEDISADGD